MVDGNDTLFEWAGFRWRNGHPWGAAHPDPRYVWYADPDEAVVSVEYGSLLLGINDNPRYFDGIGQTKGFGCGYVSTIETFLYGRFRFEYVLPRGIHLWPAIWLSGIDSWPPEIDIVEGWSGEGYFIKGRPSYRKIPGFNRIHPGVFYGRDGGGNPLGKGFGSLGSDDVTFSCLQDTNGGCNSCELLWHPDRVCVKYNGRKVMDITDRDILDGLCGRMYVCLDSAPGNGFTDNDYAEYLRKGSCMEVVSFLYENI